MQKPFLFLYGNCQMNRIAEGLALQPNVGRSFQIRRVPNFKNFGSDAEPKHVRMIEEFQREARNTAIFIYQAEAWDKNSHVIMSVLPPQCERIPIYSISLSSLWPHYFKDAAIRKIKVPNVEGDYFPCGDSYVTKRVKAGDAVEDIVRDYAQLDLNSQVPLDNWHSMNLDLLRKKEAKSAIRVADVIEERFQDDRLFWVPNHPTNLLFSIAVNQLLGVMGFAPLDPDASATLSERPGLGNLIHQPVHPSVIRYFKLKFLTQASLYHHHGEYISFDEWVRRYAEMSRQIYGASAAAAAM